MYIFHINSEVNPLPCSLSTLQYKMFMASNMFSYKCIALFSHQCYRSILFLPSMLTTEMCNVLYFYFLMAVTNLEYQHMCTLKCRNEELYPLMIAQYKVLAMKTEWKYNNNITSTAKQFCHILIHYSEIPIQWISGGGTAVHYTHSNSALAQLH
jgi:hypothetical protein